MSADAFHSAANSAVELRRTALHDHHVAADARMVDFAGWHLPIQYESVISEHQWTRSSASLFDVSHMGVVEVRGDDPGRSLERLTPAGISTLAEGRQRSPGPVTPARTASRSSSPETNKQYT